LNHNPSDLCLWSSWDYRHLPSCPALLANLRWLFWIPF
jgi:hypothetical protein